MARIIDMWTPTLRMQRQKWRAQWDEQMRRLEGLRSMYGKGGEFGGPEFGRAKSIFDVLGSYGPVSDVSGVGDLNAAELSALTEARSGIGEQLSQAKERLRTEVGRLGGGGSELAEMGEGLETGAMRARVEALGQTLRRAQDVREQAKERRVQALGMGGTGMAGLAQMRESGRQFDMSQMLARLQTLMGAGGPGGGMGWPSAPPTGSMNIWEKFTPMGPSGYSRLTEQTEARNVPRYWPTQYGQSRYPYGY